MKFSFDKDWLERHAGCDQNLKIAAGSFSLDQVPLTSERPMGKPTRDPRVVAIGRLIKLSRRKRAWNIDDLAEPSRIDVDRQKNSCRSPGKS
jgi:hypothetical protein